MEQHKLLTHLKETPELRAQIPAEIVQLSDNKFDEVKARFEYQTAQGKTKLRSSWCSLDLGSRAEKVGMAELYRSINPLCSQLIHGSFGALKVRFDLTEDEHRIEVPPSMSYCREALIGGHMCAVKTVETLSNTFKVQPIHSPEKLTEGFYYAWGKPGEPLEPAAAKH